MIYERLNILITARKLIILVFPGFVADIHSINMKVDDIMRRVPLKWHRKVVLRTGHTSHCYFHLQSSQSHLPLSLNVKLSKVEENN